MIQLFTTTNCPQCTETKIALKKAELEYVEKVISSNMHELKAVCAQISIDYKNIKSAPIMIAGNQLWTGADCVIAIEEEEYLS
jgi:glutaredoxin